MDIAVLLTCHNRREKTSGCLWSLRNQIGLAASVFKLNIFLVDDGCNDGTAEAALRIWPSANIIAGDGSLFWCGGMRKAWLAAAPTNPDYYLLVNDDTILFDDAVERLLALCPTPEEPIIAVGAIRDPKTGHWAYGGLQADTPFVDGAAPARLCRTMNANCALIPRVVYERIGMFYSVYRHAMGDMDYGLQAGRNGIAVYETSSFVGECRLNPEAGSWKDRSLPRMVRWQKLISTKALPPIEWMHYCKRNCGVWWPRYVISPYIRILLGL
jgi:GT2 family glycosyltransferase